jgi:hypothetical protein
MAKCLNGGACVNGKCVCQKNFDGEFCENNLIETSNAGWIILVIVLLAALGVGVYLLFINKKIPDSWTGNKQQDPNLQNEFIEKDQKPINIT